MKSVIRISTFCVLFFFSTNVFTQMQECGTTVAEQSTTLNHIKNKPNWSPQSRTPGLSIVPLQFHIIGTNSGAFAIDSFDVFEELNRVNVLYADANIEFRHCGLINYINSTPHVTFIKNDDEDLCDIHDVEDAINVYFAPTVKRSDGDDICGYAYNYEIKQRVIMDNGCSTNGSTLAHELGHSFSLLHTHSGATCCEIIYSIHRPSRIYYIRPNTSSVL